MRPQGRIVGSPWLVLEGERARGGALERAGARAAPRALDRLGPDILATPPALDEMLARLRGADRTRTLGESLLDQSLVAGIGNMWLAETLWSACLSPWRRLGDVGDGERRAALETAAGLMRAALDGGRGQRRSLPARRQAVPALRDDDRVARDRR